MAGPERGPPPGERGLPGPEREVAALARLRAGRRSDRAISVGSPGAAKPSPAPPGATRPSWRTATILLLCLPDPLPVDLPSRRGSSPSSSRRAAGSPGGGWLDLLVGWKPMAASRAGSRCPRDLGIRGDDGDALPARCSTRGRSRSATCSADCPDEIGPRGRTPTSHRRPPAAGGGRDRGAVLEDQLIRLPAGSAAMLGRRRTGARGRRPRRRFARPVARSSGVAARSDVKRRRPRCRRSPGHRRRSRDVAGRTRPEPAGRGCRPAGRADRGRGPTPRCSGPRGRRSRS